MFRKRASFFALFFLIVSPAARGQVAVEALEVSPEVLSVLSELQEGWLDWLSSVNRDSEPAAAAALASLFANTRELGMSRLPELSRGAAARAVLFAAEGDFARADLSIAAAEQLDPGRPDVAFATSRVARVRGDNFGAMTHYLRGVGRMFGTAPDHSLWMANLQLWILAAASLIVVFVVALLMATRGQGLIADLSGALVRYLPSTMAFPLTFAFLLWPLLLPSGLFWLVVFCTCLLWGYVEDRERVLLAALLVVLLAVPWLVNRQRVQVAIQLSPQLVAAENLASGRVEGAFALDLAQLRADLPGSVAVTHLLADLYSRLGQWNRAEKLYLEVLKAEPGNLFAMLDLGTCQFHRGKYEHAIASFEKAAGADSPSGLASFNLSQAYSELYRFEDAARALGIAQEIDVAGVARWIQLASVSRVVGIEGGVARTDEIREELIEAWSVREKRSTWARSWRQALLIAVPIFLIGFAGPHVARRISGTQGRRQGMTGSFKRRGFAELAIPGLERAAEGEWGWALAALVVPVLLLTLPGVVGIGFSLPSIARPDPGVVWIVACGGLFFYLLFGVLVRVRSHR